MPLSLCDFSDNLCASGLMSREQLDAYMSALTQQKGVAGQEGNDQPNDSVKVSTLIRELVASNKLTQYQAKRIAAGTPQGLVLGNNIIEDRIGAGGMGEVFRARHRRMNRVVAIKVLNERSKSDYSLKRFQREMEAAAQLVHPNIVTAYDADEHDGTHFIVMEYVDGTDLATMVERDGPLNLAKASNLVAQAAKGLLYAHTQGIIHRDIKPGNILVDKAGRVKILDMGLARFSDPIDPDSRTSDSGLTRDNQIVGTVDFMAPEQADDSKSVSFATDIYSLGCTLYFLLTGTPPYFRSSIVKTLVAHQVDDIPEITAIRAELSGHIDEVFRKMVAKSAADRFASMADVIRELRRFEDTETDFRLVDSFDVIGDGAGDDETRIFDPSELLAHRDLAVDEEMGERSPTQSLTATLDQNSTLDGARAKKGSAGHGMLFSSPPVGIDVGTMYTTIATIDETGSPVSLPSEEGELRTYTALLFEPDEVVVGKEAIRAETTNRDMVARNPKLELGQHLFRKKFGDAEYPPEVLVAWVLNKVKRDSTRSIGDFSRAVFAVPARFDEVQRRSLLDAGYIAGLDVVDMINEPIAAAISYCHQHQLIRDASDSNPDHRSGATERFLVCDLGEGMLDIGVIEFDGQRFKLLTSGGDLHFGGRDWKHRLVGFVTECFRKRNGLNPLAEPNSVGRISRECEESKQALSAAMKTYVNIDYKGISDRYEITRELFEEITSGLTDRLEKNLSATLATANLQWNEIDRILLTGGASNMPTVVKTLERVSEREIEQDWILESDSVAQGAALFAAQLQLRDMGQPAQFEVININSRSLGVVGYSPQTKQSQSAFLIRRNTGLPTEATRTFRTNKDGQNSIVVQIIEGESRHPEECHKLGNCIVRNLPADLPARTPIDIRFMYEHNGLLNVSVKIDDKEKIQKITRRNEMTVEQLDEWKMIVSDDDDDGLGDDLFDELPNGNSAN